MTVQEARKILANEGKNLTDEEIKFDIETAELFKDLFFNNLTKNRKQASTVRPNMP